MRHYVAVQDASGKWFYANEGRSRITGLDGWIATGACSATMTCPDCKANNRGYGTVEQRACQTCGGSYSVPNPSPCQGHDTMEEAYEHERQRKLKGADFYDDDPELRSAHRCDAPDCKTLTSGGVRVGTWFRKYLCAEHRTMETVDKLFRCGESWES